MSRKQSLFLVGVFAPVAFAAGIMQGCGGGSSSSSNVALCEKACDKALECAPDAGAIGQQALGDCKARCQAAANTHCSNEAAIVSAANACLAMSCDGFLTCSVPNCQTTTGTGGTGGTTGTGGTGGGDCSVCTKAEACCTALAGGQACNLKTMCDTATADAKPSYVSACQSVLTTVAGNPQAPAACQ
jgi:hypothetical protein